MPKHIIFTRSIVQDTLVNIKLSNEILKILEQEKNKKYFSEYNENYYLKNREGFQTKFLDNKLISEYILKKSMELIVNHYEFNKKIKFVLSNFWINSNKKGDFNIPHTHPDSDFSGIYYLNVPKNGGELIFLLENKSLTFGNTCFLNSSDFIDSISLSPKNNMFVLFPSGLSHMVSPHNEDIDRVSLSFNIKLHHENNF
tara:strand:+ start:605 stop:1201 length:597 start_codon:yes stop_codon:yes gene_type:complete